MNNICNVMMAGYLARDGEVKYSERGLCILTFSLGVNRGGKARYTGEWKDETDWWPVTMFGEAAEDFAGQCRAKTYAKVAGTLQIDKWEKDGMKRERAKVIADKAKTVEKDETLAPKKGG